MIKSLKIPTLDLAFYLLSLALCFLIFQQGDLIHTYTSSYAYLNGHFVDFYDFNKVYMERNDYLPGMYVVFALWGLPLKVLGLISSPEVVGLNWVNPNPIEIFWFKLLLALLFFGCTFLVYKIGKLISPEQSQDSLSPSLLFATSPIAIFAVFIFSQYDVIGVLFTLLGLYFYFQKKFWKFALFFSIAISFKYFAALIYLPLVLLVEKRPIELIKLGLIGALATAIQIGAYWHSEAFRGSFFYLAKMKTSQGVYSGKPILLAFFYFTLCAYAYFSKVKLTAENRAWSGSAVFICASVYAILFTHVHWHPQWLIILMPFFALALPYIRHQKTFIILELVGYLAFICISVNWYPGNADVTMSQHGILSPYVPPLTYFGMNLFLPVFLPSAKFIFQLYLYMPILFWVFENVSSIKIFIKNTFSKIPPSPILALRQFNPVEHSLGSDILSSGSMRQLYRSRAAFGGYLFLIITIFCIYRSING